MTTVDIDPKLLTLAANTIRIISAEGVEKANSGHPGMPMGVADYGALLWLKYLRFNPKDPQWINRDRFVLSNGHGSMFLYTMLHLSGYDLSLDDIKSFRQWESRTPGHPEFHMTPGVEATTGPLGQGISNAVGMSIGSRVLGSRYNAPEFPLVDHRIFVFCGDGCLMEGVSGEASSLAGHLGLGNIIVLYDDNHISIAGSTKLAFTESVIERYKAYGWHTQSADGHDFTAIDNAIQVALSETSRPSLIALRTIIGKGSPNKAGSHDVHGSPLGKEELEATKKNLNWPSSEPFFIPEEVRALFASRVEALTAEYDTWQKGFRAWKEKDPERAAALEAQWKRMVPADLREKLVASLPKPAPVSTRKLSGDLLQVCSKEVPALIGGSADLEPSTLTLIKGSTDVQKEAFSGLNMRFGVREHGMGAIMNGLSYYGGFIPYGSTFLCFSDYMRPTIRLAALSSIPGLFIFTHESVFLGEDGPTHQPIEHLQSLRLIPNLWVVRPADGLECAVCYAMALARRDGPVLLAFTRQNLDPLERRADFSASEIEKGGYVVWESAPNPELVLIATGSEVSLAQSAARELSATKRVRVVSIPCTELFEKQGAAYRKQIIPEGAKKVTIEAGVTTGWREFVGGRPEDVLTIGIDRYGASAPAKVIAEKFGLTTQTVVANIRSTFSW